MDPDLDPYVFGSPGSENWSGSSSVMDPDSDPLVRGTDPSIIEQK